MRTTNRVFAFLACAALGYFAMVASIPVAARFHATPNVVTDADVKMAQEWILVGGLIAYGLGLFAAIGFFFAKTRVAYWLLFAPIYVPLIYTLVIIARLDALFGLAPAVPT